jgi:ABC-type multidrug transport system ATPase subunit
MLTYCLDFCSFFIGMDPYSRRATWDLLKKKKEGRVIILTTHFSQYINSIPFPLFILFIADS